MYTFVMDFNLKPEGADAERYLVTMMNEWPGRFDKIDGVLGSTFLANAFGLAGRYSFRMVLDMKSLATLREVDKAYKTDALWKTALGDWFKNRREVQSRLLKQHSGDENFMQRINKAANLSFIYVYTAPTKVGSDAVASSYHSLIPSITYTSVVQSEGQHGFEAWNNIPDIEGVDAMARAAAAFGALGSQLFAVLRAVDGALRSSA